MWLYDKMGIASRGVALRVVLVFLGGTLVGSMAPESGNVLASHLGFPSSEIHAFNPCFLALGVIGVVLAFFVGCKCCR